MQADTTVRNAANILTFDGADYLDAAMNALAEPGGLSGWRDRYEANVERGKARNDYDRVHRATARAIGQAGGTVMGAALVGPARGAVAAAPRLPGAAKLSGREFAAVVGGGGVAGLGVQNVSDMVEGRSSSWGDKAASVVGGAAGAAALPLGPARAGSVGGWITSAAQDALNGRQISLERAGEAAIAGGLFGNLGNELGIQWSDGLAPVTKGKLGEIVGDVRSTLNGSRRDWVRKTPDRNLDRSRWVPDGRRGPIRFEDKFGYGPSMSSGQLAAQDELDELFRLSHTTPSDVGLLFSVPASALGVEAMEERPRKR